MVRLITEGFLNEERFAKAFAGGKFRMKSWGKMKIVKGLEAHGVSSRCIQRGLAEIEQDDYKKTLRLLLNKKLKEIDSTNSFAAKHELSKYLIRKGYEPELVWSEIKSIEQSLD